MVSFQFMTPWFFCTVQSSISPHPSSAPISCAKRTVVGKQRRFYLEESGFGAWGYNPVTNEMFSPQPFCRALNSDQLIGTGLAVTASGTSRSCRKRSTNSLKTSGASMLQTWPQFSITARRMFF